MLCNNQTIQYLAWSAPFLTFCNVDHNVKMWEFLTILSEFFFINSCKKVRNSNKMWEFLTFWLIRSFSYKTWGSEKVRFFSGSQHQREPARLLVLSAWKKSHFLTFCKKSSWSGYLSTKREKWSWSRWLWKLCFAQKIVMTYLTKWCLWV